MASSQNQLQKAAGLGVEMFKHGIFSEFKSAYLAKVISYDNKKHIADVQPLVNLSSGQESAQYLDIPVAESCYILDEVLDRLQSEFSKVDSMKHSTSNLVGKYPKQHFMREGVPVVVAVLDRDIDNWKGGNNTDTFDPNSSRLHDGNDSIVIAVLGGDAIDG